MSLAVVLWFFPASAAAAQAPTAATPREIDYNGVKFPDDGSIVGVSSVDENTMELKTQNGQVIRVTKPGATPPASGPPSDAAVDRGGGAPSSRPGVKKESLTPEEWLDIREELSDMKRFSPDVSGELLREGLMEKAERLAANYLRVAPGDLPASVHRRLRLVVDGLVAPGRRPIVRPRPNPYRGDRGWDAQDEGEDFGPSYPQGPYAAAYAPPRMAYAPMVPYPAPYPPRRGFLHHLLCPCSWCR
jgi:hypothetical protein